MNEGEAFPKDDGPLFGDGSCQNPEWSELSRAGFSVVQVSPEGSLLRGVYGHLPCRFPQSSLAAEYAAFSVAASLAEFGCQYVGDCQDVLSSFAKDITRVMSGDNVNACTWKALCLRVPDFRQRIASVSKIKAHRNLDKALLEGDSLNRFYGNAEADKYAGLGALLHDLPSRDISAFKLAKKEIVTLAEYMIDSLKDLKADRFGKQGLRRLSTGMRLKIDDNTDTRAAHNFSWNGNMWECSSCCFRSKDPLSLGLKARHCQGQQPFASVLAEPRDHRLVVGSFRNGGVILYCSKCFHYANPHPRMLGKKCKGSVDPRRSSEHFYLSRHMHPVSKLRFFRPVCVA